MIQSILVVEDQLPALKSLVRLLESRFETRADVVGVACFEDAIKVIESREISVLITDIELGGERDGYDLIRFVKRHRPRTFVLVVTAYATTEAIPRWIRSGAFDVLDKPISMEKLTELVQRGLDLTTTNLDRDALTERLILEEWEIVRAAKSSRERGVSLENLCSLLFSTIPGWTKIESRLSLSSEEFDLAVDNEAEEEFWKKYGSIILVECKNWHRKRKPGRVEFDAFFMKLRRRSPSDCRLGFFVSINGFTSTFLREAQNILREPQVVVPLDSNDIWGLILAFDRGMALKNHVKAAVLGVERNARSRAGRPTHGLKRTPDGAA